MSGADTADAATWGTEIVEATVLGHPCLVFERRRHHVADLLLDGRRFADREYLVSAERRVTFAEHEGAVAATHALLRARGVQPGDRVVLYAANAVSWVVSFWAILNVGGVVVLGNAWWSEDELRHAVETTSPRLIIIDGPRQARVPDGLDRLLLEEVEAAMTEGGQERSGPPAADEDDPAVVLFTSGTTGPPKGAVLSHRGIVATLQSLAIVTRRLTPEGGTPAPPSRSLLSLPLFHIGGLQQIITPMLAGGTLVFAEGRFDPERIVGLVEREQIAVWSAVPTMVSRVIDHLAGTGHGPLPSIRTLGLGGSPVPEALRASVPSWFPNAASGPAVTYGLSEAGGVVATGVGAALQQRPGCVGRPLPCASVRIAEPDDAGVGEVLVRSPSVMLGYWDRDAGSPGKSDGPVTADRWLATGDIGRIDDEGYLYILDRSKDIVIRGGENIATPHVENRLLEHRAVREAVVIGLPHAELGEELAAVVVLHGREEVTEQELAAFCKEKLAYFEVPTRWWLRDDQLPQNDTGKIVKRALQKEWLERLAAVEHRG